MQNYIEEMQNNKYKVYITLLKRDGGLESPSRKTLQTGWWRGGREKREEDAE